jgi:hypothetical protein
MMELAVLAGTEKGRWIVERRKLDFGDSLQLHGRLRILVLGGLVVVLYGGTPKAWKRFGKHWAVEGMDVRTARTRHARGVGDQFRETGD